MDDERGGGTQAVEMMETGLGFNRQKPVSARHEV